MSSLRLMAIHAHPDDESSKGAASVARYVAEGVDVTVLTMTGGERGDILNPALDRPEVKANISEVRRAEMAKAAEILGVRHLWAGFMDSGLPEGDPLPPLPEGSFAALPLADVTEPVVRAIRELRPQVITTYDENGGYPHPDHIRTHEVSMAAFEAAADPTRFPDSGPPWQPLKLYYHLSHHRERLEALHEIALSAGLESPYERWLEGRAHEPHRLTTRIRCDDWFGVRDEALRAHATQVEPEGWWFALPRELQVQAWPTEDFELARSLVVSERPEDDLFAGIREVGSR